MSLKLYNSYSKNLETFKPKNPGHVKIYNCGPTVYNYNHIGNFRSYMSVDILRRYLLFLGYKVEQATNITDVDDKIISNSMKAGQKIREFTEPFTKSFLEDLRLLKIQEVEHRPRATESIDPMLSLIGSLKENGHTYTSEGNIYFRLKSFKDYGKLSGLDTDTLRTAADGRFDADEYDKEDVRDFALWKAPSSEDEPSWDSPWGKGRPGWHLECSAMIRKIFGNDGVDIHAGGIDLLFPHHENEIAQSCCAFPSENFVRYWIHNEHLLVNGKKMSKSLGNYYTLRDLTTSESAQSMVSENRAPEFLMDLIAKNKISRALRYLLLSVHYRTKLNFTFDNLLASDAACTRIQTLIYRLLEISGRTENDLQKQMEKISDSAKFSPGERCDNINFESDFVVNSLKLFIQEMDNDLNTARALAVLFDFVREINLMITENRLNSKEAFDALLYFYLVNEVLDVLSFSPDKSESNPSNISESEIKDIENSILLREEARKNRDFKKADEIRDSLLSKGIRLIDTPDGTKWETI